MPRISTPKKELVQFRLLPHQIELLEELAGRTGQSQSEHLRQAVIWYLQNPQIRQLLAGSAVAGDRGGGVAGDAPHRQAGRDDQSGYAASGEGGSGKSAAAHADARRAADAGARRTPEAGSLKAAPHAPTADDGSGVRILVVENQTLVRELLAVACEHAMPSATVQAVGSGAEALAACRRDPPTLMMLDLVLSDGDGLDRLGEFFSAVPGLKVIALSSHINEFTLHRALKARVHGIVDKNEQPVKIIREAIRAVLAGQQYISTGAQRLRSATRADPASFDKVLSDREQEVLRLIGEGMTNELIAERLGLSVATARNHRLNIMASLDIHSAPQLVRYAIDKGFAHLSEGSPKLTKG